MTETVAAPDVSDVDWARALTLAERVCLELNTAQPPVPGGDGARAARRLARWRDAHRLGDGDGFDNLLRTVRDGADGLLALLAEPAARRAGRAGLRPAWWLEVCAATAAAKPASPASADHPDRSDRPAAADHPDHPGHSAPAARPAAAEHDGDWRHAFAVILAPVAHRALTELARRLRGDPEVSRGVAVRPVLTSFLGALNGVLVSLATRTLILELNVLRELGRLDGDTPADRFASFVGQFTGPDAQRAFYAEYPVLARLLVRRAELTTDATWELLRRWAADRDLIRAGLFGGTDPGALTAIGAGAGDPHRDGRSVTVLTFAGGGQVVYKPRPQGAHLGANALLRWLSGRTGLQLRTLTVLDRGGYGWLEFARHAGCASAEEVTRYYRRLGAQMALLHAVNGTDFHFENLIACGEQPVLVDLEALFHQPPPVAPGSSAALDPAVRELELSVMRTGLLPMLVSNDQGAVDISGLGGDPRDTSPYATATWDDGGTDTMRVVRANLPFAGAQNRPSLDGTPADLLRYIPALLSGFRDAYRAFEQGRDELTAPGGPLAVFEAVEVRMVLRATQTYTTLLQEGTHPDLLRDALDRDRHLSYLWAISSGVPGLASVVPFELADLWSGDVPLFTSEPGSRDLVTSHGVRLAGFYAESGLDRVRAKLAAFGERDLARQTWTIRAALQTRAAVLTVAPAVPAAEPTAAEPAFAAAGGPLAVATGIAERLLATACEDGDRVSWLGLEMAGEQAWRIGAPGWNLYSGSSGIAVFLAAAAGLTGRAEFGEFARRARWWLPAVLDDLESAAPERLAGQAGLHGFAGLPGLAYALLHMGETAAVERLVRLSGHLLRNEAALDVMGGAAGTIGCLLAVHAATGLAEPLELARRGGELLLATAQPAGDGLAWPTFTDASQPLTGFSHGAGGVGWALLRLGAATGEDRFVTAGLAGFAYERAQYRPELGNWPDLRAGSATAPGQMFAWCHGAPGIGLARADTAGVTTDIAAAEDLELALAATVAGGFGRSHSLCHGDLGNLELLLAAAYPGTDTASAAVLASIARTGPRCGTPGEVETPGLMCGLAGIGYGLLRLYAPDSVPSLLLMRPPAGR
ncbi:type 2 lanthipeptide synthetase LanM family protein [Dactylosporangium matsuzakiense]|uniref:Lantibiotic biosynthesis protein dehydration domain-containing protein n=1 Tax=Dactylosporangium matsuzakiense TaxID=53360 RepID=A0A9W6KVS7_9ACTN|nr:type 2 lanthipeptide synthetase LanM family protein [Dactylosporangium matsuzakiense]GLL08085.1 hypothetical protein GCM10017581_098450 [Dactylosporangium matsuzakiense]